MAIKHKLDGGWGWMIVLGSAIVNCIFGGYIRGHGIFFSAYQSNFGENALQTALVNGVRGTIGTIMCLLAIGLIKRFSERLVVMVAGSFISLSFILCVFANSMTYVIFVNGIFSGIGSTALAIASQLIVGKYFDKRKSLATTLAFSGSGVGQLALPSLLVYWLHEYGVNGMMLLFGGLTLHFFVVAAIYTPFEKFPISKQSPKQFRGNDESKLENSTELVTQLVESNDSDYTHQFEDKSLSIQPIHGENIELLPATDGSNMQRENGVSPYLHSPPLLESTMKVLQEMLELEKVSDEKETYIVSNEADLFDDSNVWFLSDSTGSVCVATEELYKPRQTKKEILQNQKNNTVKFAFCTKLSSFCRNVFVLSIFKNVRLSLYFIVTGLGFGSFISQSVFLIPRALEQDVAIEQAAFLLSIVGGVDIVGRIIMGLISDIRCVGPIKVVIAYSLCMAVANGLMPLCDSFASLAIYAVVFGLFGSAAHVMTVPIILTISSRDVLLIGVAMSTVSQSIVFAILPVFMGLIRDSSETYASIFYTCTVIQMTLAVLMGIVLFLNKRVNTTKKSDETEITYG